MPTRCEHWLLSVPASGEGASGLTESSCASQKDPGGRSRQGCSFVSLGSGEGVLGSVGSGLSAQTPRPAGRERGFWPPAPPFPTGFRAVLAWPAGGEEPLQMAGREPPKNQPAPCHSIPLTSKALASRR